MTAGLVRVPGVRWMVRNAVRRFVERMLSWYDPATEARRDARSEAIQKRSIAARVKASEVRAAYRATADELHR